MSKYTLVGVNGNAYAIMGYTSKAMRRAGFTKEEVDQMYKEATSGDYSNLICICDDYIDKVNERLELTDGDDDENDDADNFFNDGD